MASLKDASPWIPFDLYDFFGYIFPGVFLILSIGLWGVSCPQAKLIYIELWEKSTDTNFIIGLFVIIFFLVFVYTIGHCIAALSHLVDRVLIAGISGYPVYNILDLNKEEQREYSDASVKYVFMLLNIFLLSPIFLQRNEMLLLNIMLLEIIGALIFFRIMISIIKMTPYKRNEMRNYISMVGNLPTPRLFLKPAKFVDLFFVLIKQVFQIDRKFPKEFMEQYSTIFKKNFNLNYKDMGSENYWLPYFQISSQSAEITNVIRTWLHLYSFARNLSTAAYIISSIIAIWLLKNPNSDEAFLAHYQLSITLFIAIILFTRFYVLYSTYYTKNIIRSFVILNLPQEEVRQ